MKRATKQTVLALYPNTMGVGYAVFSSPEKLEAFGIGNVRPVDSKKSLRLIKKYITKYDPDVVVLRAKPKGTSKFLNRTKALIDSISELCEKENIELHKYSRKQIKHTFKQFKAYNKHEISEKLIKWYPKLKAYQYPKRKDWESENYSAGIFDCVSIATSFFYLN